MPTGTEDRPVSLPAVRAPSDRVHDEIKGEYTDEDAVRPGKAVGEHPDDTRDSGLISGTEDVRIQDPDAAIAAETDRRVAMSSVELDEAEARDALAKDLLDAETDDEKERLDNDIPAVGGNPEVDDNGQGTVEFGGVVTNDTTALELANRRIDEQLGADDAVVDPREDEEDLDGGDDDANPHLKDETAHLFDEEGDE